MPKLAFVNGGQEFQHLDPPIIGSYAGQLTLREEIGDTADDGICQVTLAALERVLAGLQWTLAFWTGKAYWLYRGGFSHAISPRTQWYFAQFNCIQRKGVEARAVTASDPRGSPLQLPFERHIQHRRQQRIEFALRLCLELLERVPLDLQVIQRTLDDEGVRRLAQTLQKC